MSTRENIAIGNAIQSIQNGNYSRAKSLLNAVITNSSNKSELYRLIGIAEALSGELDSAKEKFLFSIKLNKKNSFAYMNLGNIYKEKGDFDNALICYREALLIDNNGEINYNLGHLYELQKNIPESINQYKECLRKLPGYLNAILNLSSLYIELEEYEKSIAILKNAISNGISTEEIYINLSHALNEINEFEAAENYIHNVINKTKPNPRLLLNLGNAFLGQKKYLDALNAYEKVLHDDQENSQVLSNLGHLYTKLKNYENAEKYLQKSINIDSKNLKAITNLAVAKLEQQKLSEAEIILERALNISPNFADAHLNLAHVLLNSNQYSKAWNEYEWRWKSKLHQSKFLDTNLPIWNGEERKKVLIWPEQGIGDQLLFSQLFDDAIKTNCNLSVITDYRLIPIFSRTYPEIIFIDKNTLFDESSFDYQIPIASLGKLFRKNRNDFIRIKFQRKLIPKPSHIKELNISIEETENKYQKLCGLSWTSTNLNLKDDKSVSLETLLPILKNTKFKYIDLQYVDTVQERAFIKEEYGINIVKLDEVDSFYDLDAVFSLIDQCECVVTVSNTVAHMSAAMGKPTFIILPFGSGKFWYWVGENNRSFWYQTAFCFSQTKVGDWEFPIKNIDTKLRSI